MRSPLQPLKYKHFAKMFKVAWDKAFTRERNMKGWEKEGILPRFSRKEYWHFKTLAPAVHAETQQAPCTAAPAAIHPAMSAPATLSPPADLWQTCGPH